MKTKIDKLKAVADLYYDAGFHLTPLIGKRPLLPDWQNTKLSKEQIYKYIEEGRNLGMLIPPDTVVMDVDTRNFKDDDQPHKRLAEDFNLDYKKTIQIATGSGGFHYIFKKPKNVNLKNELDEYKGVEFKSAGRQVVIPESIHPISKRPYKFITKKVSPKLFNDIPDLPKALIQKLQKNSNSVVKVTDVYTDSIEDIAKTRIALRNMKPAVEGDGGDNHTYKVACICKDNGISPLKALDLMLEWNKKNQPQWTEEELQTKIDNAYQYSQSSAGNKSVTEDFSDDIIIVGEENKDRGSPLEVNLSDTSPDGKRVVWHYLKDGKTLQKNLTNTENFFKYDSMLQDLLAYNDFDKKVVFVNRAPWMPKDTVIPRMGRPLTDNDTIQIMSYLNKEYRYYVSKETVSNAIIVQAMTQTFHPVREYLDSLEWDGKKKYEQWLPNFLNTEDNAYTRAVGKLLIDSLVQRIYEPGCKFDYMIILEGNQGVGKSSFLRNLVSGDFFSDPHFDINSKDAYIVQMGKWLIELPEMDAYNKAEANSIKKFVTTQVDNFRLPYEKLATDIPRQSVLVGTINPDADGQYLKDQTGNRRFLPIRCGNKIFYEKIIQWRDRLFAEAVYNYKNNRPLLVLPEEARMIAGKLQEDRRLRDSWTESIDQWLDGKDQKGIDFFTSQQIYVSCFGGTTKQFTVYEQKRLAKCMHELGFKSKTARINGKTKRGYGRVAKEAIA